MSNLKISDDLSLPLDAVTQTFAILAKRGVGKTHTGSVMAEEMLKVGQPIVVYDPTGAWWGLKSSADGKHAGYPVVIFGGEHADVPLEESAGETVASVIVERRIPAILDCGLMRKGARIRFMTDFCEALYHKNREALHFFVDEAQTIAPQNLKAMPEAARLLGAMEDIVLQGRRRGLGMTIISPRPAVVNTNLRSACEVIIAMQIVAPHDRKAIQEWVDLHGDDAARAREMMDSLSSLKRGEAWVWSPSWLEIFRRVTFRPRETFDSSATPTVGQKIGRPTVLAPVDLEQLGAQIKATVERAKADDPRALRAELAKLRAELAKAQQAKPAAATVEARTRDVPVLKDGQLDKLNKVLDRLQKTLESAGDQYQKAVELRDGLAVPLMQLRKAMEPAPAGPPVRVAPPPRPVRQKPCEIIPNSIPNRDGELSGSEHAILDTVLMLEVRSLPATRESVARWLAIHPNGGRYGSNLGRLRADGYLDGFALTDLGRKAARDLATGVDAALAALPDEGKRRILRTLMDAGRALSREELAASLGIHPNGGRYGTDLGWLRTMGLLPERGPIAPTEGLYR